MKKISYIKSDDRAYNVERCLSLIKSEIMTGLRNARNIVIKPSCITSDYKLTATHVETLRSVLSFIKPYVKGQIFLAEGARVGDTLAAFKNFGYLALQDEFGFSICDCNDDNSKSIDLLNDDGTIWSAKIANTVLQSDYLISISSPKTDKNFLYAGAIENITVGPLIREETVNKKPILQFLNKFLGKKNYKELLVRNKKQFDNNLVKIYRRLPLRLSVIDGYELIQSNGGQAGDKMFPAHFCIASSDPIASDWLGCKITGIEPNEVSYISQLLNNDQINYFIIGDDWQKDLLKLKLPSSSLSKL